MLPDGANVLPVGARGHLAGASVLLAGENALPVGARGHLVGANGHLAGARGRWKTTATCARR